MLRILCSFRPSSVYIALVIIRHMSFSEIDMKYPRIVLLSIALTMDSGASVVPSVRFKLPSADRKFVDI